jgi:hypothetical protein
MVAVGLAIVLSLIAVVPSSFIAMLYLRKQGEKVALWEAPPRFMEVGPPLGKLALISFNFLNIGIIIYVLFFYLDL